MDIMRANRLATDTERARAWNALMSFRGAGPGVDGAAIQFAADTLCADVAYRLERARIIANALPVSTSGHKSVPPAE